MKASLGKYQNYLLRLDVLSVCCLTGDSLETRCLSIRFGHLRISDQSHLVVRKTSSPQLPDAALTRQVQLFDTDSFTESNLLHVS